MQESRRPRRLLARCCCVVAIGVAVLPGAACDDEAELELEKERDFRPGTVESPREEAN